VSQISSRERFDQSAESIVFFDLKSNNPTVTFLRRMSKSDATEHSFKISAAESPIYFRILLLCAVVSSKGAVLREESFGSNYGFYEGIGTSYSVDIVLKSWLQFKLPHIRRAATSFASNKFRESGNSSVANGALDGVLESLERDRIDVGVHLKEGMSKNQGHLEVRRVLQSQVLTLNSIL